MRIFSLILIISIFIHFQCTLFTDIISGHVYDADTGAPVEGAWVRVYYKCNVVNYAPGDCGSPDESAMTDSGGFFFVELKDMINTDVNGDSNGIKIRKDGYIDYDGSFPSQEKTRITVYLKKL